MPEEPPTTKSKTEDEEMFDAFLKDAELCQTRYKFGLHFEKDLVYYGIHLGTQTREIEDEKGRLKSKTIAIKWILTSDSKVYRLSGGKTILPRGDVFFKNLTHLDNLYSISSDMLKCLKLNNLTLLTPRTLRTTCQAKPHGFTEGENLATSDLQSHTCDMDECYSTSECVSSNVVQSGFFPLSEPVRCRVSTRPDSPERQDSQDSQERQVPPGKLVQYSQKVGIGKSQNPFLMGESETTTEYCLRNGAFFTPETKHILTHAMKGKEVELYLFQIFEIIKEKLRYYVGLPEEGDYDLLALYVMGTYIYPIFPSFPYIQVSAIKESGKSRLLNTMSMMCFASLFTSSQKVSPLFRFIDGNGGTVVFDEAEGIALEPEKIQIINAGYSKTGGGVLLTDKNNHQLQEMFDTYSPKLFGSINNIPPTVITRSIRISIEKSSLDIYDDRISAVDGDFPLIRDLLYVFGLKHGLKVQECFEKFDKKPEGVRHRYWELYKPLVAIASYIAPQPFVDELMSYISDKVYLEKKARLLEDDDSIAICALVKLVQHDNFYDLGVLTRAIRDERGAVDIIDKETDKIKHMDESYKYMNGQWVSEFLRRVNLPRKGTHKGRAMRYSGSRGRFLKPSDVVDQAVRMNVVEVDPLTNEYRLITDGSLVESVKPVENDSLTKKLTETTPEEPKTTPSVEEIMEKPEEIEVIDEGLSVDEPPEEKPLEPPQQPLKTFKEELEAKKQCSATRRELARILYYYGSLDIKGIKFDLTNKHHDYEFIAQAIEDFKREGYITENDGYFVLLKEKDEFKEFFEE